MKAKVLGRLAPVLVGALLVGACSGDGGETASGDTATPATTAATGAEDGATVEAEECATDDAAPEGSEEAGDEAEPAEEEHAEGAHAVEGPHFTYGLDDPTGPCHWGDLDPEWETCKTGTAQSPIDIVPDAAVAASDEDRSDIVFDYGDSDLTVFDNGHTVQATYGGDSTIVLDGTTYRLDQFHFHADSEHEIGGDPSPLEIHFVHKEVLPGEEGQPTTTTQPSDAVPQRRIAVIGVLIEAGEANPAYAAVMDNMPTEVLHTAAEIAAVPPVPDVRISAADMLPADDRTFFHYEGSLTTPGCGEGVSWQVMAEPVHLSAEQIAAFTARYENNSRPLQADNGRTVQVSG